MDLEPRPHRRARGRWAELDRASFAEIRERIAAYEAAAAAGPAPEPRSYPGFPSWSLERPRARRLKGLDAALAARRSVRVLGGDLPSRRALGHLLHFAHGVHAPPARGPTPSAGDLQALELYAAVWSEGWLPRGVYHYDRAAHRLAQLHAGAARAEWSALAPSMEHVEGGALLWIIAGDAGRAMAKYGERGERFLLLEAGHLMQSLCLLSTSLGLAAVPLGGVFEAAIAARLRLLDDDIVLYAAAAGVRA